MTDLKIFYKILSKETLLSVREINKIENLSHLSIHFLIAFKPGRKVFRNIIKQFNITFEHKL